MFDLIELIVHHYSFGQKSELIKLVEYAAGSLEEIGVSVGQREVMLRLLCNFLLLCR